MADCAPPPPRSKEVQAHGFSWEKEISCQVYKATVDELKTIQYTSRVDLPKQFNRLNGVNVFIKTSCNLNVVCMSDCLRLFDAVCDSEPLHLTVVHYTQITQDIKKVRCITEVDLTNSRTLLFGTLTREDLKELDDCVKSVPQKRKPTIEEHEKMYTLRNALLQRSGAIQLNIKCDKQQSRLQCSFNKFQQFLKDNPDRVVAQSTTNEFRGGTITSEIMSQPRKFVKSH